MIDYHDCGFHLQVEHGDDAGTLVCVYYHGSGFVTDCPTGSAPLPTEVMQHDPDAEDDDLFQWDEVSTDTDLLQPYELPNDEPDRTF